MLSLNDTHREILCSVQEWLLAASNLFHMFTQSIKFYTFHYHSRCFKNVIHQIDSKNEWLLLSASVTAKFELVFVLTLENAFSWRFHSKANRRSSCSSKNSTTDFQNSPPFERLACFYVTSSGNFECFQSVLFFSTLKQIFWKMKTYFKKLEYRFLVEMLRKTYVRTIVKTNRIAGA